MGKSLKIANIGKQMDVFGKTLTEGMEDEWNGGGDELVAKMGDQLDDMIQVDVFGAKRSPSGQPWAPYSPLTKEIYAATGRSATLGGTTLRQSFQIGKRGNLWRPGKFKFSLGSILSAGGHSVAKTFQTAYRFPKTIAAARKMRKYIAGLTGTAAPRGVGTMFHPKRQIVGWKPTWIEKLLKLVPESEKAAWEAASKETAQKVRQVTKGP